MTTTSEERRAFARDARLLAMRANGLARNWLAYDLRDAADVEDATAAFFETRERKRANQDADLFDPMDPSWDPGDAPDEGRPF